MPAASNHATVFTILASYLTERSSALLVRWRNQVRSAGKEIVARLNLPDVELDDHLPSLIAKLADALRLDATPDVEPEGAAHGAQRRRLGYQLGDILWELQLFRRVLTDALREFQSDERSTLTELQLDEARERIIDVIDRSVTASAMRFSGDTEAERNAATRVLAERTLALEEADRQKNRFLAMLSHELRNPISPIVGAAELLKHAGLEPRFERAREIIARQARYQARLLDDLLEVGRIVAGKVELKKSTVDVRDAVRQALETCAGAIEAKNISLALDLPEHPILMNADAARLVQIVTNLLTNAVKFTLRTGHVWVTLRRADAVDTAVLRVQDDGIGIGADMLPRVFEMFAQADTSLDRSSGGLGVGLTLARYLVESHGGQIEAHSDGLGMGATFVVRLPVAAPADQPVTAPASVPRAMRVGLIEDNADSRIVLAQVLEHMGFTVLTAEDGERALRLAEMERPDAYVIDVGLPGMDGFDVARRIRQIPAPRRPLLIALTGYGNPEHQKRAADAGFDHHMTKPTDFDRLERLLRAAGADPSDDR